MPLPAYEAGALRTYVESKGWEYKTSGGQIVLKVCPLCGVDTFKWYGSDDTGLWDCKRASCGKKGNFYQLQRELGDSETVRPIKAERREEEQRAAKKQYPVSAIASFEETLAADEDALAYLAGRGITADTARAWHLGVKLESDGVKWLMIPYLVDGNMVADVKYRTLPPADKRFRRKGGGESILFGEHILNEKSDAPASTLYLVEGEIDAITMWQQGFRPVLSTTAGAATFKTRWYDLIQQYNPKTIVVCYDSDEAGQKGAEGVVKRFSDRVVLNVELPDAKDVNEYFLSHTAQDFSDLVAAARPLQIENCSSIASVFDELESQLFLSGGAFYGVPSQFGDINAMTAGGYWNGQLVTVCGTAGTGKTTFVLQELWKMATNQVPVYFLCLEMPETMMLRKLVEHVHHIPMLEQTHREIQQIRSTMDHYPFFMGDKIDTLEKLEETVHKAAARHDIKCFAFDNINFFVRSIEHTTQELARATKRLKDIATDVGIPIISIAQPKKFDRESRVISIDDIKDSVSIQQDSDTIILLYRKPRKTSLETVGKEDMLGNQSPYTLVKVDKARYAPGGSSLLYFSGDVSTFRELSQQEKDSLKSDG